MKLFKFFAVAAMGLFCSTAVLAQNNISGQKFFDNTFVGIGGGVNLLLSPDDFEIPFVNRLTPAADAFVGKWFTPSVGGRLGYKGLKAKGAIWNILTDEAVEEEYDFMNFYADFLWNISNTIGGYKPGRFWSFSPYLGAGYMRIKNTALNDYSNEFTASVGLLNILRITHFLDITIDVRGIAFNPRAISADDNSTFNYLASATAGVVFKIGADRWQAGSVSKEGRRNVSIRELKEAYQSATEKANSLSKDLVEKDAMLARVISERDNLRTLNNNAEAELICLRENANKQQPQQPGKAYQSNGQVVPIALFFEIGKPDLGAKELVNLAFYVKNAISVNPDRVFTISGVVDNSVGKNNKALAQKRTEYVYNLLVKEYGVNPKQLVNAGAWQEDLYDDARLNRVVIIK